MLFKSLLPVSNHLYLSLNTYQGCVFVLTSSKRNLIFSITVTKKIIRFFKKSLLKFASFFSGRKVIALFNKYVIKSYKCELRGSLVLILNSQRRIFKLMKISQLIVIKVAGLQLSRSNSMETRP